MDCSKVFGFWLLFGNQRMLGPLCENAGIRQHSWRLSPGIVATPEMELNQMKTRVLIKNEYIKI